MPVRDFATLIAPVSPEEFFRDTWEKRPLAIRRGDRSYYDGLFSIRDVDEVIAFTQPRHSALRVIKKDAPSRQATTATLAGREDAPDLNKLYAAYRDGYTINVSNLQERWGPLAQLCAHLESFLGHPAGANMYLTPRDAQGFAPHFDTHDVFIVQTHGEKTWRLYEGPQLPLDVQGTTGSVSSAGALIEEVHLEAGDLLYIPRGVVHEARTSTSSSLHVTVGIFVFRWVDLIGSALTSLARGDERFREALPPGWLHRAELLDPMQKRLEELLASAAGSIESAEAVDHLTGLLIAPRGPRPDGHFEQLDRAATIDLGTTLVRRAGMICRIGVENGSASISFPGGALSGPGFIEPALRFIAAAGPFRVRELPDGLDDDAKCLLARRLLSEGLLTIVAAEE